MSPLTPSPVAHRAFASAATALLRQPLNRTRNQSRFPSGGAVSADYLALNGGGFSSKGLRAHAASLFRSPISANPNHP